MELLILTNLITLGLFIMLHRRVDVLTKELLKTQHEIGYKLWNLENKLRGEMER